MPSVKMELDLGEIEEIFRKLSDPNRIAHVARGTCLAGAKVLKEEAKLRVSVDEGTLRDNIYVAFSESDSTETEKAYTVSWRKKQAPHGHLIEFGHWLVVGGKRVGGKNVGGIRVVWVAAKPFLRPAYDASIMQARDAMIARAKQRMDELLKNDTGNNT